MQGENGLNCYENDGKTKILMLQQIVFIFLKQKKKKKWIIQHFILEFYG